MRNVLAHFTHKEKETFAGMLKGVWNSPTAEIALKRADELIEKYRARFPGEIDILEAGLEDTLAYYSFEKLDFLKISSSNMLERLNKEIRRRSRVVGIT